MSAHAPGNCRVNFGRMPAAGPGMRLCAGPLQIRMFAAFAVRTVPRRVTEALGHFLLSVHSDLLGGSAAAIAGVLGGVLGCRAAGVSARERPGVPAPAALVVKAAALAVVLAGPITYSACVGVVRQMDHAAFLWVDGGAATADKFNLRTG